MLGRCWLASATPDSRFGNDYIWPIRDRMKAESNRVSCGAAAGDPALHVATQHQWHRDRVHAAAHFAREHADSTLHRPDTERLLGLPRSSLG
jgi:hypothetical protein